MKELREINDVLDKCCQLALGQPLPDEQQILKKDAIFQARQQDLQYWLKNFPTKNFTSTSKTYAPVAYDSKTFTPS